MDFVRNFFMAPRPDSTKGFQDAEKWMKEDFEPDSKDTDYGLALDFANRRHEDHQKLYQSLDSKAEKLFQFAAGFSGAIFALLKASDSSITVWFFLSYVCFGFSLIVAVLMRIPQGATVPASVKIALESVEKRPSEESKAWLAASLHCAIEGMSSVCQWKARKLTWASYSFILGIILLLCAILSSSSDEKTPKELSPKTQAASNATSTL